MSIKDLINQAYNKDAEAFEATFSDIMADKMETAIGAKYDEMFGVAEVEEGYKKKMKEEDEPEEDEDDDDEDDEDEDEE